MIVCKVQRSLDPPHDRVLIYSEDHSVMFEGSLDEHLAEAFGEDWKIFVRGYIDDDRKFVIVERAPWQPW